MKNVLVLLGLLFSLPFIAQVSDKEIADYHFNQGKFAEAKLYYERLYNTDQREIIYPNYLKCLTQLKDWETAEDIVKKRAKQKSNDGIAYVQWGALYLEQNRNNEAAEQFETAIEKVDPSRAFIIRLANEFNALQQYEWAIKCYEKGKKKGKDGYLYNYEIASTKGSLGDLQGMIDAFIVLLLEEPHYLSTVETLIARLIKFEDNLEQSKMLRTSLLKAIQTNPDNAVLSEFMIWYYLQTKNYDGAMQQSIGLDKRLKENGMRIMEMAQVSVDDDAYDVAALGFQYVISKGPASPYYYTAHIAELNARLKKFASVNTNLYDWKLLEKNFQSTMELVPHNDDAYSLIDRFIQLKGYHLQHPDSIRYFIQKDIDFLQNEINTGGYSNKTKAKLKLLLGDLFLAQNAIWEASLLFSQVELDYKEDIIGNEARFKNAKVSFYNGDFGWSQSQLEALKGSTSKLLANDAIDLSLLITENIQDSIQEPLQMYARAELYSVQQLDELAISSLDSISASFPGHPLIDEALYLEAMIAWENQDLTKSEEILLEIIEFHFIEIKYDDAIWKLGQLNEKYLNNPEKAMGYYEKILTEQPGSLYVTEARKSYRRLRGDDQP
jgi:tetratricopeptide (TPR) repeat protein